MNVCIMLEELRKYGSRLSIKGDKLIVTKVPSLPPFLIEQLIVNKHMFIEAFRNDDLARNSGFIVGLSGLLYEYSLNRYTSIYLEHLNKKWFAWRETHQKGNSKAMNVKAIEIGNEFEYVLLKAKKYINFVQNKTSF